MYLGVEKVVENLVDYHLGGDMDDGDDDKFQDHGIDTENQEQGISDQMENLRISDVSLTFTVPVTDSSQCDSECHYTTFQIIQY